MLKGMFKPNRVTDSETNAMVDRLEPCRAAADRPMRRLMAIIVGLSLILAACGGTDTIDVTLVSPSEAAELIESSDVIVLDVRTPAEVATGALPRARNIDLSAPDFTEQVSELDRNTPYLVYCQSGNRSRQATAQMAELGFTDVYELDGGVLSWVNAGRSLSG